MSGFCSYTIRPVLERFQSGLARIVEAACSLSGRTVELCGGGGGGGVSERHLRRLRDKYETDGAEGLTGAAAPRAGRHRWTGIEWMLEEHRTRHLDFNAKHFHERIKAEAEAEAEFEYGYTWTKTPLQKAGLIKKARRRSCHRKKRPRRPLPGIMLLQDGSPFRWVPGWTATSI